MFGSRSRPIVFDPYRGRRRRGLPSWLWLLMFGIAVGVAAVIGIQQELLPERLSAAASADLRAALETAEAERASLRAERDALQARAAAQDSGVKERDAALAAAREQAARLQGDLKALLATLPPDPRAKTNAVEVRAGRFQARRGSLDYELVLTTRRAAGRPLAGVLQLVVSGAGAGGRATTVTLDPVRLSVDGHEIVTGTVRLPDDFTPRQTTVQVLDRPAGRVYGMRVLNVDDAA
jgi:hypothetical protein